MTILVLIRHAANDWVGKRLAGRTPGVHLNEEGRRQASELGERLSALSLSAVYSSPLERAIETAEAVAKPHTLELRLQNGLTEVRYGDWEGLTLEEAAKTTLWTSVQSYPSGARFPNGESLREVQGRAVETLEGIREAHRGEGEIVAVVSHGDVIRTALAHYLGIHLDLFQRLVIHPASLTILALSAAGPQIVRLNDDGCRLIPTSFELTSGETRKTAS